MPLVILLGGVTQMESFLGLFFPEVLRGTKDVNRNIYCKYDNQWLTAFTSSLFLAAAVSSLVSSRITRRVGRQGIMLFGSALFLAGSIINLVAINISMLIIGRMLLGFGIGFTFQKEKLPLFTYACSNKFPQRTGHMEIFTAVAVPIKEIMRSLTPRHKPVGRCFFIN
ncbi:hypothetical protein EJB05_13487, partial [Eragrostis curvula]